ncbi:MAG: hypothetical protein ACFFD4_23985 [Candidatus Odinarchaeota archaeon]
MGYKIWNLQEQLKRVIFDFGEEIVSFRFLKPFEGLEIAGMKLPAVEKKGLKKKIEIPRHAAEFLQERGYGVMTTEYEININRIYNKLQEEQNSTALENIGDFYLLEIRDALEQEKIKLKEQSKLSEDIRVTRERKIERMENDYGNLTRRRREKLFRKVGTLNDSEIKKKLTRSEKVLYQAVVMVLRDWEENVLGRDQSRENRSEEV